MCRCELPRIGEIRDCVQQRGRAGHYFENFDSSLVENPVKRKHFLHLEAELTELDSAAWPQLKEKVVPLFEKRDRVRDWQAAFDKLNEAKAYTYLTRLGCIELGFIPESSVHGQKTPDLKGKWGGASILCEVKTINPSDDEAKARRQTIARSVQGDLPKAFFAKLSSTLRKADTQMDAYCRHGALRKFVYIILNFDDNLHQYVGRYMVQIRDFCRGNELPCVEIIFDVKPEFYSATTESPTPSWFIWSKERTWQLKWTP